MAVKNPYGTLGPSPTRVALINRRKKAAATTAAAANVDPLYAQAQKIANMQYQATLAAIAANQKVAQAASDKAAALEAAKAGAYSSGLRDLNIGGQIQNTYDNAIKTQGGLSAGFAGNIRSEADADAERNRIALAGTGQEVNVRNEGDAMANVSHALGGYYPGTNMGATGAALAAQADAQPGFALAFGQYAEAAKRKEFVDTQLPGFAADRSKALAALPASIQAALADERAWKNTQFDNLTNYYNSKGAAGGTMKAPTVRNMADGTSQQWNPVTGQWEIIATKPPKAPPAGGTARTKAIQRRTKAVNDVTKAMNAWLNNGKSRTKRVLNTNPKSLAQSYLEAPNPVKYGEALTYVTNQLWLALGKKYGYDKADLAEIAKTILDANGYKDPNDVFHPALFGDSPAGTGGNR